MYRYKLTLEYDGTYFHGWQRQESLITVQECLETAIFPLSKVHTIVHGAGRTDAGVHALGQVAHVDLEAYREPFVIQQCMNSHMRDTKISVLAVELVDGDFHARFSAKQREYRYVILNRRAKPTLDLGKTWWVKCPLDHEVMNEACGLLIGQHDFSSFRAQGCQSNSPVKTVDYAYVSRNDDRVELTIAAPSFLYHQVRNIIGSLHYVGIGKWSVDDFREILEAKNRSIAGPTAPPDGLYLIRVVY